MAWKITRDLLAADLGSPSRVGWHRGEPQGEVFIAHLLDDDLEHYYTVEFDRDAFENDLQDGEGGLYSAFTFGFHDSGCTHLVVRMSTIEKLIENPETLALYRESIMFQTGPYKGWCSIYA